MVAWTYMAALTEPERRQWFADARASRSLASLFRSIEVETRAVRAPKARA